MTHRRSAHRRLLKPRYLAGLLSVSCLLLAGSAYADVFGRLHFTIRDAAGKPAAPALSALPTDSSIEYNPTIPKASSDSEFAGSLTQA